MYIFRYFKTHIFCYARFVLHFVTPLACLSQTMHVLSIIMHLQGNSLCQTVLKKDMIYACEIFEEPFYQSTHSEIKKIEMIV